MDIIDYKEIFEQAHQLFARDTHLAILLNEQACILCSNNSFVNLEPLYKQSIFPIFPFLEHLLIPTIPEVSINFVETILYEKVGNYRCIIRSFEQFGEQLYFVILQDVSWYHQELQRIQQERNEAYLAKEKIIKK
ncbi:MAG: hypothetical protein OHK0045_19250 [Raineya sp.]